MRSAGIISRIMAVVDAGHRLLVLTLVVFLATGWTSAQRRPAASSSAGGCGEGLVRRVNYVKRCNPRAAARDEGIPRYV